MAASSMGRVLRCGCPIGPLPVAADQRGFMESSMEQHSCNLCQTGGKNGALFNRLYFAVSSVARESHQVWVVERPELRHVYCFVYRCYEQRSGIAVAHPVGSDDGAMRR